MEVELDDVPALIDFLMPFDLASPGNGATREKSSDITTSKYSALKSHAAFKAGDSPMVQSLKCSALQDMKVSPGNNEMKLTVI